MKKITLHLIAMLLLVACHKNNDDPVQFRQKLSESDSLEEAFKKEVGIPSEVKIHQKIAVAKSDKEEDEICDVIGLDNHTFHVYFMRGRKMIAQHQETFPEKLNLEGRWFSLSELRGVIGWYAEDNKVKIASIVALRPLVLPQGFKENESRVYPKRFVFSDDKIRMVEIDHIYSVAEIGDLGYLVQIYPITGQLNLLYNKQWQPLGKMTRESRYFLDDEYYAQRTKNVLTLFRFHDKKLKAQYTYTLPFDEEETVVPQLGVAESYLSIRFRDLKYRKVIDYELKFQNDTIVPNL